MAHKARKAALIGVPLDLGADKRGAAGGPAAIRRTDLRKNLEALGLEVEDRGDIQVSPAPVRAGSSKARRAEAIYEACRALARETFRSVEAATAPIVLGGDHSLAMGSVSGVARHFRKLGLALGVIWVDAHGDINTPATSPSGNMHGMPLAHLIGMGDRRFSRIAGFSPAVEASRVCLVGIRDLDGAEKTNLRGSGVRVLSMADIDRHGISRVAEWAIATAGERTGGVHLSFDIDAADPSIAQGTGTKKRGGLTYREAHLLMEIVAESGRLVSMDMAEVNPLEDVQNTTAELASELIQSAMGKRIY